MSRVGSNFFYVGIMFYPLFRGIEARQVAEFGYGGHGHSELHAAQSLEGFHYWGEASGFDPLLEFLVETLEAFGVFGHSADIFLKDDLLRWGRTDDLREPSEMGGVPGSLAGVADIVSQQEGFETELGVLQIAEVSSRARVRSRMASSSTLGT